MLSWMDVDHGCSGDIMEDVAVGVVLHCEPALSDDALPNHGDELALVDAAIVVLVNLRE
jgi:hypothetical protein